MTGSLVLVATPIGNLGDLSPRAIAALRDADVIACEDTRRTRALLTHAGIAAGGRLQAIHAHNERTRAAELAAQIASGRTVALVTDAGTPAVSDPGARLVRVCAEAGLPVTTVPGPSAVLAALVVSGLPTDRFTVEGFLPRKGPERRSRLAGIAASTATTVVLEAPARVAVTLADLAEACGADRPAAVARELTKVHEEVRRGPLADLAAAAAATEPRGEHVLVIGPAPMDRGVPSDDDLRARLTDALAGGASRRDAVAAVVAATGAPRRRVYDLAHSVTERSPDRRSP